MELFQGLFQHSVLQTAQEKSTKLLGKTFSLILERLELDMGKMWKLKQNAYVQVDLSSYATCTCMYLQTTQRVVIFCSSSCIPNFVLCIFQISYCASINVPITKQIHCMTLKEQKRHGSDKAKQWCTFFCYPKVLDTRVWLCCNCRVYAHYLYTFTLIAIYMYM